MSAQAEVKNLVKKELRTVLNNEATIENLTSYFITAIEACTGIGYIGASKGISVVAALCSHWGNCTLSSIVAKSMTFNYKMAIESATQATLKWVHQWRRNRQKEHCLYI